MAPRFRTQREELLWFLEGGMQRVGSHDGAGLLNTIKAADRAAWHLSHRQAEPSGSLGMGALLAPKFFAAQTGAAKVAGSPGMTNLYGANAELGPKRLQAAVRGGLGLLPERKARVKGAQ